MTPLSDFVRTRRKELGLTQETLALYAGVSAKFIVELESGKATLRMDKVLDVLRVFDCGLEAKHF